MNVSCKVQLVGVIRERENLLTGCHTSAGDDETHRQTTTFCNLPSVETHSILNCSL